jgi:hypothetical protein
MLKIAVHAPIQRERHHRDCGETGLDRSNRAPNLKSRQIDSII